MPYEIAYPITEDAALENLKFDSVKMQIDKMIVKWKENLWKFKSVTLYCMFCAHFKLRQIEFLSQMHKCTGNKENIVDDKTVVWNVLIILIIFIIVFTRVVSIWENSVLEKDFLINDSNDFFDIPLTWVFEYLHNLQMNLKTVLFIVFLVIFCRTEAQFIKYTVSNAGEISGKL